MYGLRQRSRTLPWAKCQIFLEALFIYNNIWPKAGSSNSALGHTVAFPYIYVWKFLFRFVLILFVLFVLILLGHTFASL